MMTTTSSDLKTANILLDGLAERLGEAETEIARLRKTKSAALKVADERSKENAALRLQLVIAKEAMGDACDLLMERRYGNPARSPGHNARSRLERAQEQIAALTDDQGRADG